MYKLLYFFDQYFEVKIVKIKKYRNIFTVNFIFKELKK